ncbi:MAG TPA: SDR family NAD(P)-dependent oxidoreductase [Isosphaeraceae bacterium]|nr:SDR family NAD(P)-dependent oxidoreductase [Isosphaeraceae bacterium]
MAGFFDLTGQVALVTGAGQGIGAGTARRLHSAGARIVSVASIAGKDGNPTLLPYSASKAAVIAMTKSLAKELAGRGTSRSMRSRRP